MIAAVILAVIIPSVYYFIKFNEKGYVEQKLLERYIEMKKREDIVLQTGARTGHLDVDVSLKNIRKEDAAKIKAGDRDLLPDGTAAAEILQVGEPSPNYFLVDIGSLKRTVLARTNTDDGLYSIPAKIRLKGIVTTAGDFVYKDFSVKDLAIFKFNGEKYEVLFAVEGKE